MKKEDGQRTIKNTQRTIYSQEDEKNTTEKRRVRKIAIVVFFLILGIIVAIIPVLILSKGDSKPLFECPDNLRTIDTAVLSYEASHGEGIFPATINDLVPTYLREIPEEPVGGYYYLDTTTTPPRAVCSKGHTY